MNDVSTKAEYTPEDLLTMADGDRYELVNGNLVERHMGWLAGLIVTELLRRVSNHCHDHRLGYVNQGGDGSYQPFAESRLVRKPDVSFVRLDRLPAERLPTGHARLAPDLAAEVVSPNDLYEEVDQKIEEYIRAGVRLIWVISPANHTVRVYRVNGTSASLRENDELDGEDVLPGFHCRVGDLFPRPAGAANGNASP